ncbi:MAG: DMT family transporter [Sphingomonadaceae bacterium]|nr:DMT family transporter [Sphingomonadaceae bacterium]
MTATGGFRDPRILLPFLLITLIWSSTWIVIKGQLGEVPPIWSVSYRFLLSAAAMFALARIAGVRVGLDRRGHALAALLGLLQFVLNYNLVYAAELYVTSGLVAVVFALLIVPNAALARLFFGLRVGGRFLLGSAVALAGVALLFVQEVRAAGPAPQAVLLGLGFTLGGVLAASCANVMQLSESMKTRSIAAMLGWAMLYGGLGDAALAWALYGRPVFPHRMDYWLELLYLSVIASALAFWLYYRIIRAVGPARAAYSSVMIPIVAMAISTFAEAYAWSALAIAGGLLAIAGLVIALGSRRIAAAPMTD